MTEIAIGGKTLHLALTGDGYFDIRENIGDETEFIDLLKPNTREAFAVTCRAAAILAKGGELQRRMLGESPEEPMKEGEIRICTPLWQITGLKKAVVDAFIGGMTREMTDEGETRDLVLEELNKGKKSEGRNT